MNVTNFANFFHQNSVFQTYPLGQTPYQQSITGKLNQMSDNLLNAQDQERDLKRRFDTLELSAEAAERKKDSELEEVPEGILHLYLNVCKLGESMGQQQETSLTEYRDQLAAFDQTIQSYQDMLDGKAALPEQMKLEDAASLLEAAKAAREQFLQDGAKKLNQLSRDCSMSGGLMEKAYQMYAAGNGSGQNVPRWQIDTSAKDIYREIDRALAAAHSVTTTFQDGASQIRSELKRRGCLQAGEDLCPQDREADNEAVKRASLFQSVYDEVWSTFRQTVRAANHPQE